MTQFTVGKHKTRSGVSVNIMRLKQIGGDWILVGYIPCDKILVLSEWALNGVNLTGDKRFDLVP